MGTTEGTLGTHAVLHKCTPTCPAAGRYFPLLSWRSLDVAENSISLNAQQPAPSRLIPETVLERTLRVLLADVDVDRFGIAGLD
jgi:hypothetical protein